MARARYKDQNELLDASQLVAQRRRNARVYKGIADASVNFCAEEERRRERADDISKRKKKSRRERYIVRDDCVKVIQKRSAWEISVGT